MHEIARGRYIGPMSSPEVAESVCAMRDSKARATAIAASNRQESPGEAVFFTEGRTEADERSGSWLRSLPSSWLPSWPKVFTHKAALEILQPLRMQRWPKNPSRKNVMEPGQKHIEGMALGAITDWFNHRTARVSRNISSFKFLALLLAGWFSTQAQGFMFTTIQCNKNYAAVMHVDGHNCGPSAIISLGRHTGGELWVWDPDGSVPCCAARDVPGWCKQGEYLYGKTLDIHNRLSIVDGRRPHAVMPFEGERYSLVFFCTASWEYATKEQEAELRARLNLCRLPLALCE